MKYIDEYRDAAVVRGIAGSIARAATRPWTVMEICGGQTHAIVKFGLDEMLPPGVTLVHGPGCPVCVTPAEMIDQAIELALRPGVILCSFGDMLRVPGSGHRPAHRQGQGRRRPHGLLPAGRRPLAQEQPDREVVFFAVGSRRRPRRTRWRSFAPGARASRISPMLVSHVLVPPAMRAILGAPDNLVQGFLAAGHVCAVMGTAEYGPIAERIQGADRRHRFRAGGHPRGGPPLHPPARGGPRRGRERLRPGRPGWRQSLGPRAIVDEVFGGRRPELAGTRADPRQRLGAPGGLGGFRRPRHFGLAVPEAVPAGDCISGEIMRGIKRPHDCPAFGTRCTPEHPIGAPMVSSEGACAAYYRYRRQAAASAR